MTHSTSIYAGNVRLGTVVAYPGGFRFLPATDAHKPSRKYHATPQAAIPAWARKLMAKAKGKA